MQPQMIADLVADYAALMADEGIGLNEPLTVAAVLADLLALAGAPLPAAVAAALDALAGRPVAHAAD